MVKRKKAKKVSKRKSVRKKSSSSSSSSNPNVIYLAGAALAIFVAFAFTGTKDTSKKNITTQQQTEKVNKEVKEVKENKVSDIKETKEVSIKLNIPKKKKAINQPRFNEKEIQIRFAEIDWNSNKKISLGEYLYYFKDKSAGKKQFKKVDKNGNRSISYKEYLAFKKR